MDDLRATPAAVKFLSCEPLIGDLGVLDLSRHRLGDRRR
jgi:protein gp37